LNPSDPCAARPDFGAKTAGKTWPEAMAFVQSFSGMDAEMIILAGSWSPYKPEATL